MSAPAVPYQLFVGIDIAAASASVACATDPRSVAPAFTIAQTPAGFADLVAHLRRQHLPAAAVLVALEATNTYWMSLALHLHDAGYAVSVINPAQAHQFAKALLKRAKTDAIDAQTLAQLAATLQPKPWTPPPAIYEELRQRLLQRENLIGALTQERNRRLHAVTTADAMGTSITSRRRLTLPPTSGLPHCGQWSRAWSSWRVGSIRRRTNACSRLLRGCFGGRSCAGAGLRPGIPCGRPAPSRSRSACNAATVASRPVTRSVNAATVASSATILSCCPTITRSWRWIVSCWATTSRIRSSRLAFLRSIMPTAYPVPSSLNRYRNEAKSARNATTVPPFCCVRTII